MADDPDNLNGLLGITLSSSSSSSSSSSDPESDAPNNTSSCPAQPQPAAAGRNTQSESSFRSIKATYRPKLEDGSAFRTIPPLPQLLPSPTPAGATIPKHHSQTLLHAVEELYFFRRYDDVAGVARDFLDQDQTWAAARGRGRGRGQDTSRTRQEGQQGRHRRPEDGTEGNDNVNNNSDGVQGRGPGLLDRDTRELLETYERMSLRNAGKSLLAPAIMT
ncbi:hypothetical protein MKZ38_001306 [Zalerion maritima]|uniref:Uncharacterized protein n=1 Tax=Zalerion maritima TaxID=339359 RepID=A0AAD5WTX7_9PEZI|nr:hypothetical protein MKZ38_001306 [Zalerion maritima]